MNKAVFGGNMFMDAKSIGSNIAKLRKKSGMTQMALAEKLNISDKTVSKWESGQGYPDITLFPALSALFGVTIDHLMLGEKRGIVLAGNIITDVVKNIPAYPEMGMLTHIGDVSRAVGGSVPNVGISLAKIDRSLPLYAVGAVGTDEYGGFVTEQLKNHGINIDNVVRLDGAPTAFTDVMSIPSGERTFFTKMGACGEFCPEHVDISALPCDIMHIAYIFLLEKFDAADPEYGTVMARFLSDVQAAGIKTSIDVVSSNTGDYAEKIIPALKYTNFAIMNEIESTGIWQISPRNADGKLNIENIRLVMEKMADCGVKDKVIIHAKEAGFVYDVVTGEFCTVSSVNIPRSMIKGTVGAGDAFCAGCLYGIYNGYSNRQMLEFAAGAAACNLFAPDSVGGMRTRDEIIALCEEYGFQEM